MSIRRILTTSIIAFTVLFAGCTTNDIASRDLQNDEAKYQKTMTKVQNDVNEIIGKDYEYVLENMGTPYCTTYYIDVDKIKNIKSIEELNNIDNIRLIYPKDANIDIQDDSALYVTLNDNIVNDVQTYELSGSDEKEDFESSIDIIVDRYNDKSILNMDKVRNIDIKSYIGKEVEFFSKSINKLNPNMDIYDDERKQNLKAYLLKNEDLLNQEVMVVYSESNIIKDIKLISIDEGWTLLKEHSFFN